MAERRFYDTESEEIFTEDELYCFWAQEDAFDYPNFNQWLAEAAGKNGTLEELASDEQVDNKRKWTALKIVTETGYNFEEVLDILRELNVHGNWSIEDIRYRPVDIDELVEIVEEKIERR